MNSSIGNYSSPFRGLGLAAVLLVLIVTLPALWLALDVSQPIATAQAAAWFTVPDGYDVRSYSLGGLTLVMVIYPGNEDPERNLYALWGVIHQAQARRIDAQVHGCYEVGHLTVECVDALTTFGTERARKQLYFLSPEGD